MKKINSFLFKVFKWNLTDCLKNIFGLIVFCLGINLFVEPNHLYSGGILGLAQILNHFINDTINGN